MQTPLKNIILTILFFIAISTIAASTATAQCSVCTRTVQQLGEKPAQGLNAGILYLAFAPLAIFGFVAYKWRQRNNG